MNRYKLSTLFSLAAVSFMMSISSTAAPINSVLPRLDPADPLSKTSSGRSYLNFLGESQQWPSRFKEDETLKTLPAKIGVKGVLYLLSGVADRTTPHPKRENLLSITRIDALKSTSRFYYISPQGTPSTVHSSNNSKSILIRNGFYPPERNDSYGLFLWNRPKKSFRFLWSVLPATIELVRYPKIGWSPGSRYVSYLRGGNAFGDYDRWTTPYRLSVYDTKTFQERELMPYAGLSWSWTHHGTVLCSRLSPEEAGRVGIGQVRPSVYEADVRGGAPKKLFDGGYLAQESPDGKWIAFCDWPGTLIGSPKVAPEVQNIEQPGLFLWSRPTGKRVFVGALKLNGPPSIQWSFNSKKLYVCEQEAQGADVVASVSTMDLEQQKLKPLGQLKVSRPSDVATGTAGGFDFRGLSNDGHFLYFDSLQNIASPKGYANSIRTLIAFDTRTAEQTPIAQLTNIANANPDWDWHDESGVNEAFLRAEKLENALLGWGTPAPAKTPVKPASTKRK